MSDGQLIDPEWWLENTNNTLSFKPRSPVMCEFFVIFYCKNYTGIFPITLSSADVLVAYVDRRRDNITVCLNPSSSTDLS